VTFINGVSTMEHQNKTSQKEYLNPHELSQEFGFSVSTLAKWRMTNKHLPFSKIGKYIKYKRSDIVDFLEANSVKVA
jgi:hypothetical protein